MLSRLGPRTLGLIAVAILVVVTGTLLLVGGGEDKRTVSAYFPRAVSIYEGSDVRILGVNVGRVTAVTPAGNSVRVEMEYDAEYDLPADAKAVIDGLKAGSWRSAAGEGEGKPRLGELAEAIARIKGVPLEKAMAAVEKADEKQRKDWRSNAKVRAVIAQLRAEKAAKDLEAAAEKDLAIDLG